MIPSASPLLPTVNYVSYYSKIISSRRGSRAEGIDPLMPMRIAITKDWDVSHTLEWIDRAWRGQWDLFPINKIRALVARIAAINTLNY